VDHFGDHFLNDSPLGINFDEEPKFFDPEAAQENFLQPQQAVEGSIYTDDLVRVYLREMGAVPLLIREGEVDLARRMERGKLRMQKAISRSALVQLVVVELAEQLKKGTEEIDNLVDLGDVEEGTLADTKRRGELKQLFADVVVLHKKQQQMKEKLDATALNNKHVRLRLCSKLNRAKVETSLAIRKIPFRLVQWKEFSEEIERAVEELAHFERELQKIQTHFGVNAQNRARELKGEIRKREVTVLGLYGVMANSVTRRTREIGIRIALGATPRSICGMVLREMLWILGIVGVAIKYRKDEECYGVNNDSYGHPLLKNPNWRLDGKEFSAVLAGMGPDGGDARAPDDIRAADRVE
jgi:RNA polymerase primary sigma factor